MINKRQYIILSFYLTKVMFFGAGFSSLIETNKNMLLITSLLGMILGYFLLYLFYKKGNISKIPLIMCTCEVLLISFICNNTITGTFLLAKTPTLFIMIALLVVLFYGSTKEISDISRISELWIPFSILVIILSSLALLPLVKLDNLLPIFNSNFIKGVISFCGISLLPNLLILNYKGNLKFKDISIGYIIGCIVVILVMFFILSIYGSEFASIIRYPEYLIMKKINILNYISNVENVLVMEWIVNIIIVCLICIKILRSNLNDYVVFGLFLLFIMFMNYGVANDYIIVLYIKDYFTYVAFALLLFSLIIKRKG